MERTFDSFIGKIKAVARFDADRGTTFYEIYNVKPNGDEDFLCEFHTCLTLYDDNFESELISYMEWERIY